MASERNYQYFPKELVDQIWEIGFDPDKNVRTQMQDIMELLEAAQVPEWVTLIPDQVAINPANRATLGLNCFQAWRTIEKALQSGVDVAEAEYGSDCFDVDPNNKKEELEFTQKQIRLAKGLLSHMTGKEKVLAVGTNHFTQGCRGAKAGVKTVKTESLEPSSGAE